MNTQFEIIDVPSDAPDKFEAMGTKPKFWFNHDQLGRCLYKQARPGTGEDWAEKVACELAEVLGLPHARVELARWNGIRGIASPSFILRGQHLLHGNELLFKLDPAYPEPRGGTPAFYRVTQHTLDAVLALLDIVSVPVASAPPPNVNTGSEVFVGYLLLDALIGNTDRHHENWGVVVDPRGGTASESFSFHIAPTFDHASSLGRELTEEERNERLSTRDRNRTVAAYADKARSALYNTADDVKPMATLEVFRAVADRHPDAARAWLDQLEQVCVGEFRSMLARVPGELITASATDFAYTLLVRNRDRLLGVSE